MFKYEDKRYVGINLMKKMWIPETDGNVVMTFVDGSKIDVRYQTASTVKGCPTHILVLKCNGAEITIDINYLEDCIVITEDV